MPHTSQLKLSSRFWQESTAKTPQVLEPKALWFANFDVSEGRNPNDSLSIYG